MKRLPRVTSNTRSLEEQEMKLSNDCNTTELKKKNGCCGQCDTNRNIVGTTGKDTRSTVFSKMNRQHHAQRAH